MAWSCPEDAQWNDTLGGEREAKDSDDGTGWDGSQTQAKVSDRVHWRGVMEALCPCSWDQEDEYLSTL